MIYLLLVWLNEDLGTALLSFTGSMNTCTFYLLFEKIMDGLDQVSEELLNSAHIAGNGINAGQNREGALCSNLYLCLALAS